MAVKLITKHGKNEKDLASLRQEMDILRNLRHDNIIQMIDAFETKIILFGSSLALGDGVHGLR